MRDVLNLYDCSKGHTWVFRGGCNAGCGDDCACSVPVHDCAHCGDCDYGQNEEADEIRANCQSRYEMLNPPMENSGETGNAWAEPAMTEPLSVAGSPTILPTDAPIELLPVSDDQAKFQEFIETTNRQIRAAF